MGAGRPQSLRRRSTTSPPTHPTAGASVPPLPAIPSPYESQSSHHLTATSPRLTSPREIPPTSSGVNLIQRPLPGAATAAVIGGGGGGSYLLQLQRRIEALRETVASGDRQALQASWQALKGDLDQARALQLSGGGGTAGPQAVAEVPHQAAAPAEIQTVQIVPIVRAVRSEPRAEREAAATAAGLAADEVSERPAPKPAVPLPVLPDTQEAPFSDGYRVGPLLPDGPRLPEEEGEEEEEEKGDEDKAGEVEAEEEWASQSAMAVTHITAAAGGPPAEAMSTYSGGGPPSFPGTVDTSADGGMGSSPSPSPSLSPLPEVRLLAANPAFGLRRETVSPESSPRLARRWQGMGQGKWSVAVSEEGGAAGVQQAVVTAVTNPIASQASE